MRRVGMLNKVKQKIDKLTAGHALMFTVIYTLIFAAIVSINAYVWKFTEHWYTIVVLSCTLLTVVLSVFSLTKTKVSITKSGAVMTVLEAVIGLSFLINAIILKTLGYFAIAGIFMIVMPAAQYALAHRETDEVVGCICKGIFLFYISVLAVSMFCAPALTNFMYASVFENKNRLGILLLICVPANAYLFLKQKSGSVKKYLYFASLISSVTICVFTSARTSILSILVILLFLSVLWLFSGAKQKSELKTRLVRLGIYLLILIAIPLIVFFMLNTVRKSLIKLSDKSAEQTSQIQSQAQPAKQTTAQKAQAPKQTQAAKQTTAKQTQAQKQAPAKQTQATKKATAKAAPKKTAEQEDDFSLDYFKKGFDNNGKNETITSGRITIWAEFLENLSFKGHDPEFRRIKYRARWLDAYAHNAYIQVSYSAGIIAGIAYIALAVTALAKAVIWSVKVLRKKERFDTAMAVCCCFIIGFVLSSISETTYMPYTNCITSCFLLLLCAFIYKKAPQQSEDSTQDETNE